jgi:hypothetical protein
MIIADLVQGSADDTAAINAAITAGGRCGQGCDSSTVTPALVYCVLLFREYLLVIY